MFPSIGWELRLSQKLDAFNRLMLPPGAVDLLPAEQSAQHEAGHGAAKEPQMVLADDKSHWVQSIQPYAILRPDFMDV